MGVAYFIVAEREVEGLDTFVNGKFLAKCKFLNGLATLAQVRPLMDFFFMSPEDASEFLDLEEDEAPPDDLPPRQWFDAADGLATVRGLIEELEKGPVNLPDDPLPEELADFQGDLPDLPPPRPEDLIADLREFEAVLARLNDEQVRWSMAIDF